MTDKPSARVFTATQPSEADLVVSWLAARGIPARVINQGALSVLGAVPWISVAKSAIGFEVWVTDESQVEEAKQLLAAHEEELLRSRRAAESHAHPVLFYCENCGGRIVLPESAAGHVDICPFCKHYVDVPEVVPITTQLGTDVSPM